MHSDILGVDIGGANLKLAATDGRCVAEPFPMWLHADQLARALLRCRDVLLPNAGSSHHVAVTMTGELADCFATRRQGVQQILEQVRLAFPEMCIHVYAVGGEFISPDDACQHPWRVAASNWHALANWLCRADWLPPLLPGERRWIVDIGSTTVDIIPCSANGVVTAAFTDRQRLQQGQLVYTGMQRTPVAAVLSSVILDGLTCPLMAERFATTDDAYLALGLVPPDPSDTDTADNRPRTVDCARARLARMVGEDLETLGGEQVRAIAEQVVAAQVAQVASAIRYNVLYWDAAAGGQMASAQPPTGSPAAQSLVVSGHGRPLVERVLHALQRAALQTETLQTHALRTAGGLGPAEVPIDFDKVVWMDQMITPLASRAAPAVAVAWLLQQHFEADH